VYFQLPFQHESLLIDRKDKKLSQAEKRLAKRSYELEKQASSRPAGFNNYYGGYQGSYSTSGGGIINTPPPTVPIRQEPPPPFQRILSSTPPICADSRNTFGTSSLFNRTNLVDSIRSSFASAFGPLRPMHDQHSHLNTHMPNNCPTSTLLMPNADKVFTLSDSD